MNFSGIIIFVYIFLYNYTFVNFYWHNYILYNFFRIIIFMANIFCMISSRVISSGIIILNSRAFIPEEIIRKYNHISNLTRDIYLCRNIYLQKYIYVEILQVEMRGKFLRIKFYRNTFLPEKFYRYIVLQRYSSTIIYGPSYLYHTKPYF